MTSLCRRDQCLGRRGNPLRPGWFSPLSFPSSSFSAKLLFLFSFCLPSLTQDETPHFVSLCFPSVCHCHCSFSLFDLPHFTALPNPLFCNTTSWPLRGEGIHIQRHGSVAARTHFRNHLPPYTGGGPQMPPGLPIHCATKMPRCHQSAPLSARHSSALHP